MKKQKKIQELYLKENKKAITLIALVITIVVLLILAGTTIVLLGGENGIISQSQQAKINTRAGEIEELRNLWFQERKISKNIGEEPKSLEQILEELQKDGFLSEEEVDEILGNENNEIIIGNKTISFKVEDTIKVVEPENIDDWEYTIDTETNTATLTRYKGIATTVVVPNYINGVPVRTITGRLEGRNFGDSIWANSICKGRWGYPGLEQITIEKVIISEGIENIDTRVFYLSTALKEVELPKSIKSIGREAFSYCTSLTEITIPKNVTTLGAGIVSSIPEITVNVNYKKDEIPSTWDSEWNIGRNIMDSTTGSTVIGTGIVKVKYLVDKIETSNIDDWEYTVNNDNTIMITSYKGNDTVVIIPNYINGIPVKTISGNGENLKKRFWNNDICIESEVYGGYEQNTITKVVISEGIEEIQTLGFCTTLTQVEIPESVETIGSNAFACCTSLTEITIPSSVVNMGSRCFYEVPNITVNVPFAQGAAPANWNSYWSSTSGAITINYAQ